MNRTGMHLWVYTCPADQRTAARAALGEDLSPEFISEVPASELNLTEPYYAAVFPGEALDLTAALSSTAPGASFLMKLAPDEDRPGIIHAYTPALGHYHGEINGNSKVIVTLDHLLPLMAIPESGDSPGSQRRSRHSILQAYGWPWLEDFALLTASAQEEAAS